MKTVAEYTKLRFQNKEYSDVISVVLADAKNLAIADGKREVNGQDILDSARKYLVDTNEAINKMGMETSEAVIAKRLKLKQAYEIFFPNAMGYIGTAQLAEAFAGAHGIEFLIKNRRAMEEAFAAEMRANETIDWLAYREWLNVHFVPPVKNKK